MTELLTFGGPETGARLAAGCSAEAKFVDSSILSFWRRREDSVAFFGEKLRALHELRRVVEEARDDLAEDPDRAPVDLLTLTRAKAFLWLLPDTLPLPELAVDAEGAVILEWVPSTARMVSVAIHRGVQVAYAWLDGADRGYAVGVFDGERISPRILEAIARTKGRASSFRTS